MDAWPSVGERVSVTLDGRHHVGIVRPHQVRVTGVSVELDTGQTRMFLVEELHPVVKGTVRA